MDPKRIERNRAEYALAYVAAHRALRPEHAVPSIAVGGGHATFVGRFGVPSISRAYALALGSEHVTDADLDRIEALYSSHGMKTTVCVSPVTNNALLAQLGARSYAITQFENINALSLDGYSRPRPTPNVVVREVERGRFAEWGRLVRPAMGMPSEDERGRLMDETVERMPAFRAFVASIDGQDAGSAALFVTDGVATLFATGTLPEHRNRGVQTALIAERLAVASEAGCALAFSVTVPGSASERNLGRAGFRVVYATCVLARPAK